MMDVNGIRLSTIDLKHDAGSSLPDTRTNQALPRAIDTNHALPGSTNTDPSSDPGYLSWKQYTENTSFHGIKYIFQPRSHALRRFIWLILVGVALFLFSYQVVQRAKDFFDHRINVNVGVMYTDKIQFPAVTICNQNMYRMTEAVKYGMYDFLDNYYGNGKKKKYDADFYKQLNISNVTDFMVRTAHQKTTLIDSCLWQGKPCRIGDQFKPVLTDFGVCYTFNSDMKKVLHITESGTASGLRLIFNVEQYEYMRGPENDAGVKILLHDQSDVPMVADLGFAVASGTHTLIGVKQTQAHTLDPPYGNCSLDAAHPLSFCLSECFNDRVVTRCGCRPWYMNDKGESKHTVRACNISENFDCVTNVSMKLRTNRQECKCAMPCHVTTYEPSLSFAMISQFNADRMVDDDTDKMAALRKSFLSAREMSQRVVTTVANKHRVLLNNMLEGFTAVSSSLTGLQRSLDNTRYLTNENHVVNVGFSFYKVIEADFHKIVSSLKAMKRLLSSIKLDRCLTIISNQFHEVKDILEMHNDKGGIKLLQKIHICANNSHSSEIICNISSSYWTEKLRKVSSFNLSMGILQTLINKTIYMYQQYFENIFTNYITSDKTHAQYSICLDHLTSLIKTLKESHQFLDKFLTADSFDEMASIAKHYNTSKWVTIMSDANLKKKVCKWFYDKITPLSTLISSLDITNMEHTVLTSINRVIDDISTNHGLYKEAYNSISKSKSKYYAQNISKEKLSSIVISRKTSAAVSSASDVSDRFCYFSTTISNQIINHGKLVKDVYRGLFQSVVPVIERKAITASGLWNLSLVVSPEKSCNVSSSREAVDLVDGIVDQIIDSYIQYLNNQCKALEVNVTYLSQKYEALETHMDTFLKSLRIDQRFFMDNFVQVDVFYKDLSYSHIQQQVQFEFLSLLSEVGGFLGLLLGASVLTVCELLDFILVNGWKCAPVPAWCRNE